jgi:hypothetical protein
MGARRLVWRFTTEDIAVTENMIERVHRGELARPRVVPVRWIIHERITIEPTVNETGITVRVLGRMAGLSRALSSGLPRHGNGTPTNGIGALASRPDHLCHRGPLRQASRFGSGHR